MSIAHCTFNILLVNSIRQRNQDRNSKKEDFEFSKTSRQEDKQRRYWNFFRKFVFEEEKKHQNTKYLMWNLGISVKVGPISCNSLYIQAHKPPDYDDNNDSHYDDNDNNDYHYDDDNNHYDDDPLRRTDLWLAIQTPLMGSWPPGWKVARMSRLLYQRYICARDNDNCDHFTENNDKGVHSGRLLQVKHPILPNTVGQVFI